MLAESHRVTERIEKNLTIRAHPEVAPDFIAHIIGQLVVQISREALQNLDAISFRVAFVTLMGGRLAGARICAYAISHGVSPHYTKLFEPDGDVAKQFISDPLRAELFPDEESGPMQSRFDGPFVDAQDAAHFFGA